MVPPSCTWGPPESPPQASPCDCYAALWQTEHSGVFILYVETSHFVAEVIGQKQSLVLIGCLWRREMWCTAVWLCSVKAFCSFLLLKIGSNVQKRANLLKKWICLWYFLPLTGKRRLVNGFLTDQIFLRPQGTADTNCLGCSVPTRLKWNRVLVTPQSSQTERAVFFSGCSYYFHAWDYIFALSNSSLKERWRWSCG